MTSPVVFWSHILKLGILWWIFVTLCAFFPRVPTYLHSTLFWWVFSHYSWVPLQYDGHYSNASKTLQHYLYMTQTRHNNGGLRGDSIPVAPLFCFVFQTQGPRVDFCAAVYLVAEFQKWQFFFLFLFFPPLSWKSHFHDSSSNAIINWPIGGLQSFDVTFSYLVPSAPPNGNSNSQPSRY